MVQMPFPFPWEVEKSGKTGRELFHEHLEQLQDQGKELSGIAAFIVESFQGWGAVFYPEDYVQAMREWSAENDALLIFDEIQAGFGRTGKFFAYEHYDVEPDLVICGKGISSSLPFICSFGKGRHY